MLVPKSRDELPCSSKGFSPAPGGSPRWGPCGNPRHVASCECCSTTSSPPLLLVVSPSNGSRSPSVFCAGCAHSETRTPNADDRTFPTPAGASRYRGALLLFAPASTCRRGLAIAFGWCCVTVTSCSAKAQGDWVQESTAAVLSYFYPVRNLSRSICTSRAGAA